MPMRSRYLAGMFGISTALSSWVLADEIPTKSEDKSKAAILEEIIVSARRRDEDVMRVPITVSQVGGQELERQQVYTTTDLDARVPGLRVMTGNNRSNDFQVRGVGRTLGGEPGVITYFAEIPREVYGDQPLYDLSGVSVLKGPQGTLFGRNSTGGAVLIEPTRPSNGEVGGDVAAMAGNYGAVEFRGAVNVPMSEKAAFRLAGYFHDRDGTQKNVNTGPDYDDRHRYSIRPSLTLRPTDWLQNYTLVEYTKIKERVRQTQVSSYVCNPTAPALSCFYTPAFGWVPELTGLPTMDDITAFSQANHLKVDIPDDGKPAHDKSGLEQTMIANHTELDLGSVKLKSILGYIDRDNEDNVDYDASPLQVFDSWGTGNYNQFSGELQLSGVSFNDRLSWLLGAYYLNSDIDSDSQFSFVGDILPSPFQRTKSSIETKSKALFTHVSYDLSSLLEGLTVAAGLRYTWEDKEFKGQSVFGAVITPAACAYRDALGAFYPGVDPATCTRGIDSKYSDPNWNFNVEWQISDQLFAYGTVRRGFKAGGFNSASISENTLVYDPETLTDVELGLKTQGELRGLAYRINAAVFYGWYKDQQVSIAVVEGGSITSIFYNAPKSELHGIELELQVEPLPGFVVGGAFAQTDSEYKEYDYEVLGTVYDFSGKRFMAVPRRTGNIFTRYSHEVGEGIGSLTGEVTWNYQSSYPTDYLFEPPYSVTKSKELVDMALEWNEVMGSAANVRVFCQNCFEKEYTAYLYDSRKSAPAAGFSSTSWVGTRLYGIQLGYRF